MYESQKKYYEKHKDKIQSRYKEKKVCEECGAKVSNGNLTRHKMSQRHYNSIKLKKELEGELPINFSKNLQHAPNENEEENKSINLDDEPYDEANLIFVGYTDDEDNDYFFK